jgi:carbon monoxide dehydrogenase subunit G
MVFIPFWNCQSLHWHTNHADPAILDFLNTFYIQEFHHSFLHHSSFRFIARFTATIRGHPMTQRFASHLLTLLGLFFVTNSALSGTAFANPVSVQAKPGAGNSQVIQAETVIDAPVQTVWNSLVDYNNMKNVLPGYERSTVLQATGTTKTVDLQVKASSLLPSFRYQVKIREDKAANILHIQRIAGDFNSIQASYKLVSAGNGKQTRLIYNLAIDLGNAVPGFGAGHILKSNTEKAMLALQSYCSRSYQRSLTADASR